MSTPQSVLIVDESAESREVLRTALERGGARIYEAARADQGLEMVRKHHPDLIVLDLEVEASELEAVAGGFGQAAQASSTRIVVLAAARRHAARLPQSEFVAKPYHYAALVRKIEELLGQK